METTESFLDGCYKKVPVTRISDISPLDRLGLPVFSVTTPLARDLTSHLGKGQDKKSARISAISEAIERYSAEQTHVNPIFGSYRSLCDAGISAIDPDIFDLPIGTKYGPDKSFGWVTGWDLQAGREAVIPLDLVLSPPAEGILQDVDTNGLASGNTLQEAIVHALCEVIERDALGVHLFHAMFGKDSNQGPTVYRLDLVGLPGASGQWVEKILGAGCDLQIRCILTDIGIPVFSSTLLDSAFPGNQSPSVRKFLGFGASPNVEIGLLRSITEAVQSRTAIIQAARDSFNTLSPPDRVLSPVNEPTEEIVRLSGLPTFETDNLTEDLNYLLESLGRAGFDKVIAVDLTRPDISMPVVRVRIPGLSSFMVNRRRIGWRNLRYIL